jgi:hypothetical protein
VHGAPADLKREHDRSLGVRPVCFAIRLRIRGPRTSWHQDISPGRAIHKATLTRAFRHSGGHAGPFGRVTSYVGCLVSSVVRVPATTRMVTLAGVKSGKDTGHVPVAEVQVAFLVDPSGAVTATVTGVRPGAPVTSTLRPVQPISVQALGPTTPHPEPNAATNTRVIANTARGIVTDRILARWSCATTRLNSFRNRRDSCARSAHGMSFNASGNGPRIGTSKNRAGSG